jgi:hypothetical protein
VVIDHEVGDTTIPPTVKIELPWESPKLVPDTVTLVPATPDEGVSEVMVRPTVKEMLALSPPITTTTG